MKLDQRMAEALVALIPTEFYQHFLNGIRQDLADAHMKLETAEGNAIGRLQGRAQLAREIIDASEKARATLDKFRNQR